MRSVAGLEVWARVASASGAGGVDQSLINARLIDACPINACLATQCDAADLAKSTIAVSPVIRPVIQWNPIFGRDTPKSCSMAPNARAIFVVNQSAVEIVATIPRGLS